MTARHRQAPSWLDDDARRRWRRLEREGAARDGDPATVAAYCFTAALRDRTRALIDRLAAGEETTWTDLEGQPRPHPALAIEAVLAAELLELERALGLEPTGREALRPSRVLVLDEGP
jgi:P27 family predicted phage terminase small subunit